MPKQVWLFVDDQTDAATAIAAQMTKNDFGIEVCTVLPKEFRETVLAGKRNISGALLDVELSDAVGEFGSGPGIAQDIRVKQRSGEVEEFPVVRFARKLKVEKNVGGDTSSNDLFDIKIQKEDLNDGINPVLSQLLGVREVYDQLEGTPELDSAAMMAVLGLGADTLVLWSDDQFRDRLAAERQVAVHTACILYIRTVIMRVGLLIGHEVLSYRLGVDKDSPGWEALLKELEPISYKGAGSSWFRRWWSRGLEEWWFDQFDDARSLAGLTIDERVGRLSSKFDGLNAMAMPKGSAGNRPWRLCELSREATPPRDVPVDPYESVGLLPMGELPTWVDPLSASLGQALGNKDKRLNGEDLRRLGNKYGAQ